MKLPAEGNVGTLPPCASFAEYAPLAAAKLGLRWDAAEAATMDALWAAHAQLERPLLCFLMMRGVLARPIERLILLDRLLFAREAGLPEAYAREVFDPLVSPRCYAVVAASPVPGTRV